MKALMVAGTSSWAGKSLITTALCASLRRRGVRVAPFKAQNMSNNARVVTGGEIGAAQYFQALAAGVEPSTAHNPVLLKPESDTSSQVVVGGQVDWALSRMPWRERAPLLWDAMTAAFDLVASTAEVVVLEGAGSPAEINLADVDLVNLRMARHARAEMVLVCDIDRGGAFAHLYGTWARSRWSTTAFPTRTGPNPILARPAVRESGSFGDRRRRIWTSGGHCSRHLISAGPPRSVTSLTLS
jgi:adenosylcobyric acid synthase